MWSITRFKGRLWVSYIFGSNKDFEERKSSVEILTKVVLESFYKTYDFRMSIGYSKFLVRREERDRLVQSGQQTVNTINPTFIGYGFWWGLCEGLG
jgi:hypothetical protein